jgi:hypothetical protein
MRGSLSRAESAVVMLTAGYIAGRYLWWAPFMAAVVFLDLSAMLAGVLIMIKTFNDPKG